MGEMGKKCSYVDTIKRKHMEGENRVEHVCRKW